MDDARNGQGPRPDPDTDGEGDWSGLNDDAPARLSAARRQRPQPSGAANRRASRERAAKALAEAGQLELRFPVRVMDCDPLIQSGDFSEDDLTTSARLSAALAELLPDMVRHYAKRLEEQEPRALSLYALTLPGSRTALGEARLADLEIAQQEIRRQAVELVRWHRWLQLIAPKLAAGETVQDVLDLEQLRALRSLGRRARRVLVRRIGYPPSGPGSSR
jgi:hypothetical protein